MVTCHAHNVEITVQFRSPPPIRTMNPLKEIKILNGKPKICGVHHKTCYVSKKEALTHKNRRYKFDHVKLRAYPCPNCNYWHLTSKI